MKYRKWGLEERLEILSASLRPAVNTRLLRVLSIVGKNNDTRGEAGLNVTFLASGKELKRAMEENRILLKLLSNKEIELEVQIQL